MLIFINIIKKLNKFIKIKFKFMNYKILVYNILLNIKFDNIIKYKGSKLL